MKIAFAQFLHNHKFKNKINLTIKSSKIILLLENNFPKCIFIVNFRPEKNKVAAPKKNDKKDEPSHRFKNEKSACEDLSSDHYKDILKKPVKQKVNSEFPVLLMEAIYPADIPNLPIHPKA